MAMSTFCVGGRGKKDEVKIANFFKFAEYPNTTLLLTCSILDVSVFYQSEWNKVGNPITWKMINPSSAGQCLTKSAD